MERIKSWNLFFERPAWFCFDYLYDANGNMTVDKNKDIQSIAYNHLNLPWEVVKNSRGKLNYTYSASGQKLSQEVSYSNGDPKKTIDYAGPHYYENKNLLFVTTNEGRVVMKPSPEYQYFLKDHLGNIHIVLTSKTETEETTATLESDKTNTEESNFINYRQVVKINTTLFDHTNQGPTYYSSRLSGTTREKYGLAKSLSVMPGDKVSAEVFAKYLDTNQGNRTAALSYFLAAIVAGTAPTGTIVDGGSTGLRSQEPPRLGVLAKYNNTPAPQAYLTWLIFDRNYSYITGGFRQISTTAREYGQNCAHERLTSGEINITQSGYVYFYLSNENSTPVEVYFDDFKVSHTKSPIVQSNDYYPFGMTFNSYSRENSTTQRFKFQGQENIDDLKLNWDAFQWRNYSSEIGRFFNVDPLAEMRESWTPYNAMRCNPILNIDPNGAFDTDFLNKETGETQHVNDGINQMLTVSDKDYNKISELNSPLKQTWNKEESQFYLNSITNGEKLDWNSDLGMVTRVVYGEMNGIGTTSNADRQIVAESIVNRKESGLYGQTYTDVLTPSQYNAMATSTYKNGPYAYMNGLKEKQPFFYKAHESKIRANFLNSLSVSFKAMNSLGTEIGNGVVSYVSPPLKSTYFDKDPYLKNITTTIPGLKGISGAWKRK